MRRFIPFALIALAGCQQAPEPEPTNNLTVAVVPSPTPSAMVRDLSRYEGKYPSDVVEGSTFLADPAIRDAVASAVPDMAVRARVLDADVTATPIVMADGRLLSYGCEPHNCGPHNWAIAVTPDAKTAAICYFDQDAQVARWYPEGAGPAPTGGCPSGD